MLRVPRPGSAAVPLRLLIASIVAVGCLGLAAAAWAVTPSPITSPVLIDPLDPRAGEDASLVGAPLLAVVVVVGAGAAAVVATVAYVKFTNRGGRHK